MVQKWYNLSYEILLVLLKNRNHLRGIAQELNSPHTTIMRRLDDLEKLHVIDYVKQGKNKIFFIKQNSIAKTYIFQSEIYKLQKIMFMYPKMSIFIDDILKIKDVDLVVLFGSHAKQTATPKSDIDIFVMTKKRDLKKRIEKIHSKINVKIGPFDTTSPLIQEIINNHVIIVGFERYYEFVEI